MMHTLSADKWILLPVFTASCMFQVAYIFALANLFSLISLFRKNAAKSWNTITFSNALAVNLPVKTNNVFSFLAEFFLRTFYLKNQYALHQFKLAISLFESFLSIESIMSRKYSLLLKTFTVIAHKGSKYFISNINFKEKSSYAFSNLTLFYTIFLFWNKHRDF